MIWKRLIESIAYDDDQHNTWNVVFYICKTGTKQFFNCRLPKLDLIEEFSDYVFFSCSSVQVEVKNRIMNAYFQSINWKVGAT